MRKRYDPNYVIQEFRATLDHQALAEEVVFFFVFPYHLALEQFLGTIAEQRGKKIPHNELPPWSPLNGLITAAISSLVHPFRKMGKKQKEQKEYIAKRHLLILGCHPRPTRDQLLSLIIPWIRYWVEHTFKSDIVLPAGAEAYQRLLDALGHPETDWESMTIGTILEEEDHPFLYTAVPSVLAARLAGQRGTIGEGKISLRWRLTQQAEKHLALVSDPIEATFITPQEKEIKGHFVYLVEFLPHHDPGTPLNHFIHIHIACRRYAEKRVTKLLGRRSASLLIGIHQPRILNSTESWPATPILVPLPFRQSQGGKYYWSNRLVRLLRAFQEHEQSRGNVCKTVRPLEDLASICDNPRNFWAENRAIEEDECYILFAEGIKRAHWIKTGFSPYELYEVWGLIMQQSAAMMTPVSPIERSAEISRPIRGRTLSMIPFWELHEEKRDKNTQKIINTQILTPFQEEISGGKKTAILNAKAKQACCQAALERVFPEQRIGLIFLYWTDRLHKEVDQIIKKCYVFSSLEFKPERIQDDILITPLPSPGNESDEDEDGSSPTGNLSTKRQRYQQWKMAYQQCKNAWEPILTQAVARVRAEGLIPALLVEVTREDWDQLCAQQNPKHIVRDIGAELEVGSQMLQSRDDDEAEGSLQGRIENALADLLVRQNGLIIGDISELYRCAGVPTSLAKRLTVVGLYRCRSNNHHVNFPVAVRILPTGQVEMQFPTAGNHSWQSYGSAQFALGRLFSGAARLRQQKRKTETNRVDPLYLEDKDIERFVESICMTITGPTLVLLEASDFRGSWQQLQNRAMVKNQNTLVFSEPLRCFDQSRLQDLWVVRLREAGSSHETPQYVRVAQEVETRETYPLFASGLFSLGTTEGLSMYHSIGHTPSSGKQPAWALKIAEGSTEAFKHSHILEIIPFFRSAGIGDDELARISHVLRFTPSWEMGSTILPLPNHLGRKAVEDYLWILPER